MTFSCARNISVFLNKDLVNERIWNLPREGGGFSEVPHRQADGSAV